MSPQLLLPDWDANRKVHAFCTLRAGGYSTGLYSDERGEGGLNLGTHVGDDTNAVAANRAALRDFLPSEPTWLDQVHGTKVIAAHDLKNAEAVQADGSWTNRPGTVCAVMTADCLPVLFADIDGKLVGAAHAGWRGLLNGILEATLDAMFDHGAHTIQAWMGPAIGPKSFEVGAEVREQFLSRAPESTSAFIPIPGKPEKYLADIYSLARQRLQSRSNVAIFGGGYDTVQDTRFYSFRRDRVTGRMVSLIWVA